MGRRLRVVGGRSHPELTRQICNYLDVSVTDVAITQFGGNLSFGESSSLEIELGGTIPGAEHDQLDIGQTAALDGQLDVVLIDAPGGGGLFTPQAGDAFDIITATGGVSGMFASELLPDLGTLIEMDVFYGANAVTLAVVPALDGDYNFDGTVDSADYTVWRDNFGQDVPWFTKGDFDGSGVVDSADYALWAANYGGPLTGAAMAMAIPEPTAFVVLSSVAGLLAASQRRARLC